VVGSALVLQAPAWGLAVLLPLVSVIAPAPQAVGIGELLFSAILLATAVGLFLRQDRAARLDPLGASVLVLLGLMSVSVIWATAYGTSLDEWFRGIVPFLALLLVVPSTRLHVPRADVLILASFYGAGMWACYGTLVSGSGGISSAIESADALQIRMALSHEAYQIPLVAPWAFALGAVLLGNQRRRIHITALIVLSVAVALTFLRSIVLIGLGLVIVALVVLYLRRERVRAVASTVALAVVGIAAATAGGLVNLIASGYGARFGDQSGVAIRMDELSAVIQHVSISPVLGLGLGYAYSYYREGSAGYWVGAYTHNVLSYALLTMGVVGLVALSAMLVLMVRRSLAALMDTAPIAADVRYGLAFAMLSVIAYGMVQSTFRTLGFAVVLSVCCIGLQRLAAQSTDAP
jgi:O-antigen ligase